MAWSAPKNVDALIERLAHDEPTLTSVHIFQGKKFGTEEVLKLAEAIARNTHVVELYASGHDLDESAIQALAVAVGKNKSLRTICVGNSSLGDRKSTALVEGIVLNTSLRTLDLENKSVGPGGATALSKALMSGLGIENLLLARNPLADAGKELGIRPLNALLKPVLQHGVIRKVVLIGYKCPLGVSALSEGLAHSKLLLLDIRDSAILAEGCEVIAKCLSGCQSLQILKLDENNIGAHGAFALAKTIAVSSIQELHVSNTSIGDKGLAALAEVLSGSNLKVLEANSCGVGPEGIRALAKGLSSRSQLQVIKLRDNSIGDEGVEILGLALGTGCLEEIDLGNNQLGPGAGKILLEGSRLRKVNLQGARLGSEGAIALSNVLAASAFTTLLELELSACGIGRPGLSRLFEVLQGFAAPALEVLLLAGNPGVTDSDFPVHVDVLQSSRPDLDVVYRSSGEAPPTAADGGPPQPLQAPGWSVENSSHPANGSAS